MNIGFLSSAFFDQTLEDVVSFANENGFRSIELACWPGGEGKDRKYGGVSHIDVSRLTDGQASEIKELLSQNLVDNVVLGYYANPLHRDNEHRNHVVNHLKDVITAAEKLNVSIVGTFLGATGRDITNRVWQENIDSEFAEVGKVWPDIIKFAEDHNVKIAIEHCPMLWHDTWPLGDNLPCTPSLISRMFDVLPFENIGIMYDPSHLVWQQIDYIRFIQDFGKKIFCVHGQDMDLDLEMLYQDGMTGAGIRIQKRRLPGMGIVDWKKLISVLYSIGYDYAINIEHEDDNWEGSLQKVKRGLLLAGKHLKQFAV